VHCQIQAANMGQTTDYHNIPLTSSPPLVAKGSNLVPASSGLALLLLPLAARPLSPPSPFNPATWEQQAQVIGDEFCTALAEH
jgi:hypothetical protein